MGLNTGTNFNKYQGLKWGDALTTAQDLHNPSATFGSAAGFHGPKPRGVTARTALKDQGDRELEVENGLMGFFEAEKQGKVMSRQVLGGQIAKHDQDEPGKPMYFVGAFRGNQLHLTKVDGTVQMRPQFHHLDAEDERNRLAASRAAALDGDSTGGPNNPRSLLQRAKTETEAEKGRAEDRLKRVLQSSEAEEWVRLAYVDEGEDEAFDKFHERMFVKDVHGTTKLKSSMNDEEYLDAISAPRRESPNRARRRPSRRKKSGPDTEDVSDHDPDPDVAMQE